MTSPDQHQDIELNYVEGGTMIYRFGGRQVSVPEGMLVAFWGAVPHQVIGNRGVKFLNCVHIPLSWALQWELPSSLIQALLHGELLCETDPGRSQLDLSLMKQWTADLKARGTNRPKAALLEIEARLCRLENSSEPAPTEEYSAPTDETMSLRAMDMARFISHNYLRQISVDEVASSVGLHPAYAMSLFKRILGHTMTQFANQHRVWHAQRLLAMTDDQIISVAESSGFGSLTQFNTIFKRITQKTPRQFRNETRNR